MHEATRQTLCDYLWGEAPLLALRLDARGIVREANAYARKTLGENLLGRPFAEQVVDFGKTFNLAAAAADASALHLLHLARPSEAPATYFLRFLPDAGGFLVVGGADVTGMERLQVQVLELNHELADLSRQLQKANAELQAANTLKNQFLGMAAHDLRNPIGVILTYAEFLRKEAGPGLTPEHAGFLDRILQGTARMQHLIDDFLDVAIIESGRLSLQCEPTTAGALVQSARGLVEALAQRKSVELVCDLSNADVPLHADAAKLEQVLINLLGNAIEHSRPGQRVRLALLREDAALRFEVRDEAGGIPEAQRARLFTAFERAGTQKTAGERSVGLGLAIAKKIVDAHGGRIGVEGLPGQGSTFYFTVPYGSGQAPAPVPLSQPEKQPNGVPP